MKQREQGSTLYPIAILMVDAADHITGKTGLSPKVTLSKNGGAFATAAGAVSEIGNGWYALAGNAEDRAVLGELLLHVTDSGADPVDDRYCVVPWDPFAATGDILEDTRTMLPGMISTRTTLGSGAITFAYTLTNTEDGLPIADADVWATSEIAGSGVLASGRTNASGVVTFYLDAGTVYLWRQKSGWNFTNPDTETVA